MSDSSLDSPTPLGLGALRVLAHPLRIRVLDVVATYGPQTATTLSGLTGESSALMSYHLRQLAKYGLVWPSGHEGRGRERWWETDPDSLVLGGQEILESSAVRAAFELVAAERLRQRNAELVRYFTHDVFGDGSAWQEAAIAETRTAWMDADQFRRAASRVSALLSSIAVEHPDRGDGRRPVTFRADVFPLRPEGGQE